MKLFFAAAILVWLAAGLQLIATRMAVFGAVPDFVLVAVIVLSLFGTRSVDTGIGFVGGLFQGAMAGANLAGYVVSRTVTAFLVGWLGRAQLNASYWLAALVAVFGTMVAQILLLFVAPTPAIGSFLLATIGTAIYNGVLAMPVFALLRRVLDTPTR